MKDELEKEYNTSIHLLEILLDDEKREQELIKQKKEHWKRYQNSKQMIKELKEKELREHIK